MTATPSDPAPSSAAAVQTSPDRPGDYYARARPDLLALLPDRVERALDLGCASGLLGEAIARARPGARVWGVELSAAAAAEARGRLAHVVEGDLATEPVRRVLEAERFDLIVCADVLEHLPDPWELLGWMTERVLAPDGRFLISLPNVRHMSVLAELIAGEFRYRPSGILDRGHLRFFTDRSARRMFAETGLTVLETARNRKLYDANWLTFQLSRVLDKLAPDFFAMQHHYLVGRAPGG